MKLFLLFALLTVLNVILQTVAHIAQVKAGKLIASAINAVAYGLYAVVIVYMNCDLALWVKVAVTAGANLVGVYVVKSLEEKCRKDKLWLIQATAHYQPMHELEIGLKDSGLPFSMVKAENSDCYEYHIYCATQADSAKAKTLLELNHAKYFVSESKTL